jgi:hypothetical protein
VKKFFLALAFGVFGWSTVGLSYHCRSNCHDEAKFKYPCPTLTKPHRKCEGINPGKLAACQAAKPVECASLGNNFASRHSDKTQCILRGVYTGLWGGACVAATASSNPAGAVVACLAAGEGLGHVCRECGITDNECY